LTSLSSSPAVFLSFTSTASISFYVSNARPEMTFYLHPSQKVELAVHRNNNSFGVQEGAVMASGEYLQRGVCQGLCVVYKTQR
jgi:hypothetical protein